MARNRLHKLIIIVILLGMLISLCTMLNINGHVYAENFAKDITDDSFYVLDEIGNPIVIDPSKETLKEIQEENNSSTYEVVAELNGKKQTLGQFEEIEEAKETYQSILKKSMRQKTLSSQDIQVLDGNNIIAQTAPTNAIVRFKRIVKTNKDGKQYVANIDFTEVDSNRKGYINPSAIADAAYIKTEGNDVFCKMGGVVIKVSMNNITAIVDYKNNKMSNYQVIDGYLVHNYSYYSGTTVTTGSTRVGYQPSYLKNNIKYYSYDGHYFYDTFEKMISDYRNNTYDNSVNKTVPYYNYYQYLSLRSKASFTGIQYNNHVKEKKKDSVMLTTGNDFVNTQNKYTINSLMMFGVAINESGWGTSNIAKTKNNLFGLNAVDSNTGKANVYNSLLSCIEDWAYGWMQKGYLNGGNSRYRGPHLGDKHSGINVEYASDPYWGEKAAARGYYIDSNKDDYGKYTIAIAQKPIVSLYKEANTNNRIYTSEVGNGGLLFDYPLNVLGSTVSNGVTYYKVQSDMALKTDRSARNVNGIYDLNRDYVYVKASDIKIVFSSIAYVSDNEIFKNINLKNDNGYLTGFKVGQNVSALLNSIKTITSTTNAIIKDKNGNQVTNGIIKTGMTITLVGKTSNTYSIVIRGDVSGDGKISALDYVKIRNKLDGKTKLNAVETYAANANGDAEGKISAVDYVKVRNHLDGKSTIVQ